MTELNKRRTAEFLEAGGYCRLCDYPLSSCCTFKIGGPADFAVWIDDARQLSDLIAFLRGNRIRYDVFGNCSNVLFDDAGYRGVVVFTTHMRGVEIDGEVITAGCGMSITSLAQLACKSSLAGMEFAYGIPGSVGGAVYMNAGAYERQIDDVLVSSVCLDADSGLTRTLTADEHNFGYRHSVYADNGNLIVLSATFRLNNGDSADIQEHMNGIITLRRDRQPLEYPSAGSVFKRYPGYFTAKLIEDAGLKGRSVGGAAVSVKHAGFIVNTGGATSDDVTRLIDIIQKEIMRINQIEIECEVRLIPAE